MATAPVICSICGGTGWKPIDQDGTRRVVRCDCWRTQMTARHVADARIPHRYQHCSFENFLIYPNETLKRALDRARAFADAFPAVEKGLIFIGRPGIGKSHLAAAILRQTIHEVGARGLFYDVRELLHVIRSSFSDRASVDQSELLRPVLEAELLVLDDLGAERPTEWVGETLDLIVNTRYNGKRPTIFTSNHEVLPDESDLESLQVRVGFRMFSRLHEMCEFIEFDGADFRDAPPNAGADDLVAHWKGPKRSKLPSRATGPMRAQLRSKVDPKKTELKWTGGKAGN